MKLPRLAALILALAPSCAAAAPASRAVRFKAMIGAVFTEETVANMEKNTDEGYRFAAFDANAGYARVLGPFEGRDDFFMKRGRGGDVLIMVEYACGPNCTQKASAYRFAADGSPVRVAFKDMLSLPAFEILRSRLLTLCLDASGDFDTQRDDRAPDARALPACPFVLSLAKDGGPGVLYEASNSDDAGYDLSVAKTTVTPKAALRWNGKVFVGANASGERPVFVNGDGMRALF